MRTSYIAYAVPFFFILIGLELSAGLWRRRPPPSYRLAAALSDIGCGIVQQVLLLFLSGAALAGYLAAFHHLRFVTLPEGPIVWAVAFVGVDFLYYWWHRLSHEVNLLWVAHVVHHQSEDLNLAVALRQAILTSFTQQLFYVALAFVGVPPLVFASVNALTTLYQFGIHTEVVGKLGSFEAWLNTPSHHRVHHGINRAYLDKNYGATLIVWDRLFGTFAPEAEVPVYGIVKPFRSFDPIWAQVAPVLGLARAAAHAPGFVPKLRVLFGSPANYPLGASTDAGVEDDRYLRRSKYDPRVGPGATAYAFVQFALALVGASTMLFVHETAPRLVLGVGVALVLVTLSICAALLEGRRLAPFAELARLAVIVALAVPAAGAGILPPWACALVVLVCSAMAVVLWRTSLLAFPRFRLGVPTSPNT